MNSLDLDLKKMTNTKQMENNQQQDSNKETSVFDAWDKEVFYALIRLWEKDWKSYDGYIGLLISELIQEMIKGGEIKNLDFDDFYICYKHVLRSLQKLSQITFQDVVEPPDFCFLFHLIDTCLITEADGFSDFYFEVRISDRARRLYTKEGIKAFNVLFSKGTLNIIHEKDIPEEKLKSKIIKLFRYKFKNAQKKISEKRISKQE